MVYRAAWATAAPERANIPLLAHCQQKPSTEWPARPLLCWLMGPKPQTPALAQALPTAARATTRTKPSGAGLLAKPLLGWLSAEQPAQTCQRHGKRPAGRHMHSPHRQRRCPSMPLLCRFQPWRPQVQVQVIPNLNLNPIPAMLARPWRPWPARPAPACRGSGVQTVGRKPLLCRLSLGGLGRPVARRLVGRRALLGGRIGGRWLRRRGARVHPARLHHLLHAPVVLAPAHGTEVGTRVRRSAGMFR